MNDDVQSLLLAPAGLYLLLFVALILTLARPSRPIAMDHRIQFVGLFLLGIACQCAHFTEEFATGFHQLFPLLFGLPPISGELFVGFNVFWLGIWAISAFGVLQGFRLALFPIWFFALAMCLNGIAHPLLSLWVQGYFPGLISSPLVGLVGLVIIRKLYSLTAPTG